MSAEAAIAGDLDDARQSRTGLQAEDCDDFFSWIEVEHRKNTMSVSEAASLLSIDHSEAIAMIHDGSLCASFDETMEDWLVKTACVRAQLAESITLAAGGVPGKGHHTNERDAETADNLPAPHAPSGTESGAHLDEQPPFDRAGITAKNVKALMDSLDFANVRLEGSMYRIGYLEAQVNSLEEQLKVLAEFRARAAKAILVERENDILKEEIETLDRLLSTRAGNIAALEGNIATLEAKLDQSESLISRVRNQWWFRVCSWLFGFSLH